MRIHRLKMSRTCIFIQNHDWTKRDSCWDVFQSQVNENNKRMNERRPDVRGTIVWRKISVYCEFLPVLRIHTSIVRKNRLGSRCFKRNLAKSISMTSLQVVFFVMEMVLYSTSGLKTREKILTTTWGCNEKNSDREIIALVIIRLTDREDDEFCLLFLLTS